MWELAHSGEWLAIRMCLRLFIARAGDFPGPVRLVIRYWFQIRKKSVNSGSTYMGVYQTQDYNLIWQQHVKSNTAHNISRQPDFMDILGLVLLGSLPSHHLTIWFRSWRQHFLSTLKRRQFLSSRSSVEQMKQTRNNFNSLGKRLKKIEADEVEEKLSYRGQFYLQRGSWKDYPEEGLFCAESWKTKTNSNLTTTFSWANRTTAKRIPGRILRSQYVPGFCFFFKPPFSWWAS